MLALHTGTSRVSMLCLQHRWHSGWICGSQDGPGGNTSGLFIIDIRVFPHTLTQRVLTKWSLDSPCFGLQQSSIHQRAKLNLLLNQILSHLWGKKSGGEKKVILHTCQCFSHGSVASVGRGDRLAQCSVNAVWKVSPRVAVWAGRKTCTVVLLFWWPVGKTLEPAIAFSYG